MSIASRINAIEEHLTDDYSVLELAGADLTNVDKNIINLKPTWKERLLYFMDNGTDVVWNNWDKVVGEGESLSLNNTLEARMEIELKGNTQQGNLPSGYTQVEYIESTGTQYIDTGFSPNQDTRILVDALFYDTNTGVRTLFSSVESTWGRGMFTLYSYGYKIQIAYGNSFSAESVSKVQTRAIYDMNKNVLYINGEEKYSLASSTFTNTESILLLARKTNNVLDAYSTAKIYSCKIYDNNVLVRDMIPCYRNSDNEIGLYDLVGNQFYTNNGTGTFTKGSIAPTPDTPIPVQVVSGDNTIKVEGKNLFNPNTSMVKQVRSFASSNILDATTNTSISINSQNYLTGTSNDYIVVATPFDYIKGKTIYNVGHKGSRKMIVYNNTGAVLEVFYPTGSPYTPSFNFSGYLGVGIDINKNVDNEYIQISYDSNATYQAYQGSQSYPINLGVKNLFDKDSITSGYRISTTGDNFVASDYYVSSFIKVNSNTTYTKNSPTADAYHRVAFYQSNSVSSFISVKDDNNTFTTPSNCQYIRFCGLQTELDTTILTIGNHIQTISDNPIELCKIGDYQDSIVKNNGKWYLEKKIGKVVLNGSESANWRKSGTYQGSFYGDPIPTGETIDYGDLYCNYFKRANINNSSQISSNYTRGTCFIEFGAYGTMDFWYDDGTATLEQWKTWLSNNNPIVYYPLATPTYETITDTTLLSQLNALGNANSYNNQTNINQDNNDLASILNATALEEM